MSHYFIVLRIGSTCFGHYYAHHQELATMMLITTTKLRGAFHDFANKLQNHIQNRIR